ncbi:hypothetical protein NE237_012833 [Protea cynaroides]|uniref:Uncharacterized protein n=1 Tax=Protea cynaroides TaxID=273540 RepID=A0A9Q0H0W3_9MAGN|nr:hypothetical protein NE237_012833 [Protea cynaroides]
MVGFVTAVWVLSISGDNKKKKKGRKGYFVTTKHCENQNNKHHDVFFFNKSCFSPQYTPSCSPRSHCVSFLPIFSATITVSHLPASARRHRHFFCKQMGLLRSIEAKRGYGRRVAASLRGKSMAIAEMGEEVKEEAAPLLQEVERPSKPRHIALFVEPSPFA